MNSNELEAIKPSIAPTLLWRYNDSLFPAATTLSPTPSWKQNSWVLRQTERICVVHSGYEEVDIRIDANWFRSRRHLFKEPFPSLYLYSCSCYLYCSCFRFSSCSIITATMTTEYCVDSTSDIELLQREHRNTSKLSSFSSTNLEVHQQNHSDTLSNREKSGLHGKRIVRK